ncbi:MAG TPA: hypothetical protein VGH50_09920 [Candidatus Binatia bacterium]
MKRSDDPGQDAAPTRERPFRCTCGSLLARLLPHGLELKCRKCKRQVVVPLGNDSGWMKVEL